MPAETPTRVRQLISASGLTQAEFAGRAGLDASKMSKSLAGTRRFTSLDLARIAELGGVTVDWLLGADPSTPALAARTTTTSADAAIREAERLAYMRADLAYLGYQQHVPTIAPPRCTASYIDQGRDLAIKAAEHAATKNIRFWEHQDVASAVEKAFGIDVRIHELPDNFDGLAWSDDNAQLIVVGTSGVPARQRFTIMHELGHLLAGDDQGLNIDANLYDTSHKRRTTEMRANAFAAELLLPAQMLRERASNTTWTRENFARLACELWVSPSNLAWRLYNLKLIDQSTRESLRTLTTGEAAITAGTIESFGEWIQQSSRPRIPLLLLRATFQAYAEGKASLRPLANLIGIDTTTLRNAVSETREESPLAS